jgi:hypothetical protein
VSTSANPGARKPGLKSQLCHSLAVWPWANSCTSFVPQLSHLQNKGDNHLAFVLLLWVKELMYVNWWAQWHLGALSKVVGFVGLIFFKDAVISSKKLRSAD